MIAGAFAGIAVCAEAEIEIRREPRLTRLLAGTLCHVSN